MASLGDLFITVGAKIDGFRQAMGEVKSSLQSTAADVKTFGTAMTAAVTLPILGVAGAALKVAGDLEQTSIAFKTLLGSSTAASTHLKALKDFALKTPFQFSELTLASKRMQALGFEASSIIPILTNIGDAASALGMGAEGIQRIVTALGQMKAKGMVQAEEMRQLAEAGIPAWQILAKVLNTDVAGAMKAVEARTVSAATAIPAILAGMNEKFGGLMAAQSKTLLGQWSNIKDQLFFTLADIGASLAPAAKDAMQNVFSPMLEALKNLAKGFAELPAPIRNSIIALTALLALLGPVSFAVGGLLSAVTKLSLGMLALAPVLANVATAIRFGLIGALTGAELAVFGAAALFGVGIAMALSRAFSEEIARRSPTWAKLFNWHPEDENFFPKGSSESRLDRRQKGPGDFRGPSESRSARTANVSATASVFDAKQIAAAFSNLGVKNLALELTEAETAFRKLTAAGKLNAGQSQEAEDHIAKLRFGLERLTAGLPETREKLNRIPFAEKSREGALLTAQIDLLTEHHRKMTKEIAESGLTVEAFFVKKLDEAQASVERFSAIPAPTASWEAPIKDAGKALKEILGIFDVLPDPMREINEAAAALGVSLNKGNVPKLTESYNELEEAFSRNAISITTLNQAYVNLIRAKAAAGEATDAEIAKAKELEEAATRGMKKVAKERYDLGRELEQMAHRTFNSLGSDLARNIVAWKGWADTIKNVGKGFAEDFLSIMFKGLFKPLEDKFAEVAKRIGGWLSGIIGGGGSAASTATGGATSAAGGASSAGGAVAGATSGLAGIVAAVAGVATAISSVVGNFQMAGMNKSLDLIVNHTLRIFNEVFNQRVDHWHQFNETYNRLWEMQKVLMAGAGGVSIDLRNSTFGAGVNQQSIEAMFQAAFLKAQAARG